MPVYLTAILMTVECLLFIHISWRIRLLTPLLYIVIHEKMVKLIAHRDNLGNGYRYWFI